MNATPLLVLVRLELRRLTAMYGRLVVGVAVVVPVMASVGWLTGPRFGALMGVLGATFMMQGPATVMRDKMEGGLEFLVSLPVPRPLLATSRLASGALMSLPSAIGFTTFVTLAAPASSHLFPGGIWSLFACIFLTVLVIGSLMLGWTLRFDVRQSMQTFTGLLLGSLVLGSVGTKLVPDPRGVMLNLLARPWGRGIAECIVSLSVVVLLLLAYHLARTGFERFTPGRDRITW